MNKRILNMIASSLLVLAVILFLHNEKVVEAADDLVLLENRYPEYWEYLGPKASLQVKNIPGFEEVSTEEVKAENVLKDFYQGNYGGVDISYSNGVMHFEGTATEDIWPGVGGLSELTSGTYYVSLGSTYPKNIYIYFEGFSDGSPHTIVDISQASFLYLDTSQYESFKFTVSIKKGDTVDFSIEPVVYKVCEGQGSVETCNVWNNVPTDLSEEDWTIFNRRISNKSIVIFQNGSAKQYDGQWSELHASMDEFGRIVVACEGE